MQEVDQHESSIQLSGRKKRRKRLYFTTKTVRERASSMRKKSHIVVQKYIDDLAETQKSIDLNDLDEENEEVREEVDGDIYNSFADKIEVQDDDGEEEEDHIKMYEEDKNNFMYGNEENEVGDEIYFVSIALIFIIF